MKLDSKECREILERYLVKDDMEKLAVKVLMTEDSKVCRLPEIQYMSNDEIDELAHVILKIRENIGLEEA